MLQCPQCLTDFVEPATGSASGKYACTFCMDRLSIVGGVGQLATCTLFGIILVEAGSTPPKGESEWMVRKAIKEEESAQTFAAAWVRRIESNDAASIANMHERRRKHDSVSTKCPDRPEVTGQERTEGVRLDGSGPEANDLLSGREGGAPEGDRSPVDQRGSARSREEGRPDDSPRRRSGKAGRADPIK